MPIEWRGIAPERERAWKMNIVKENKLKLEWFRRNEGRLNESANKELTKAVPQETKDKFEQEMVDIFKNRTSHPRRTFGEPDPIEPRALHHLMKPVDPDHLKIFYRKEVDGRREYLKKRKHILPEQRYYLPENVNANYGWNMFHHKATNYGLGRWFIIKHSFYRRQGVHNDPDWYREPATNSPSICTK